MIPFIMGIAMLFYLYREQSFEEVKEVIASGVEWQWILLSLLFALFSHYLRAMRWKLQFKALGVKPSSKDITHSVFGNYGANLLLPRLGEVWRCNFISKRNNLSFTTVLGTLVAERVFDLFCILLIGVAAFILQGALFAELFQSKPLLIDKLQAILFSPYVWLALSALLGLLFLGRKRIKNSLLFHKVIGLLLNLWEGVKTIQVMENKWNFIFLTFGIWGFYFLNFFVCLFAFEFSKDIDISGGLILFVMGSLATLVPVQGGIGPWHFMIISTMILLGVQHAEAATFALVVHAIQQLFVLLLGIYAFFAIYLGNRLQITQTERSV